MVYTTNTSITYPTTSEVTTVSPYFIYTTNTLPVGTSLRISNEGLDLHYITSSERKENKEYICNYCGTRYIDIQSGFIPNCKNCGAKLDKVEGE